jgi:hypothetical protein
MCYPLTSLSPRSLRCEGFEPNRQSVGGCSASSWLAPFGSRLVTWDVSSVPLGSGDSGWVVWMIIGMIKWPDGDHLLETRAQSSRVRPVADTTGTTARVVSGAPGGDRRTIEGEPL